VVDVEQVVVHGQLVLGVVVAAADDAPTGAVLTALHGAAERVAADTGVRVRV
jgi:phosphoserine phosphatase